MPLLEHPIGGYRCLPGIAPYSCGVISNPGFEIVRVIFQRPLPYRIGLEQFSQVLKGAGRPQAALCALALRSPTPYSFTGFAEFNADYAAILKRWGLFIGEVNPVARTNVAPIVCPPREPVLYEFCYTRPCSPSLAPTFVVAGAGELPEGYLSRYHIVALGNTSPDGLAIKARFVMDLMEARLRGLGVDWSQVTTINVYTAHSITPLLPEIVLGRIGPASIHGATWHFSAPPVQEIEYEMDVRGVRTELRV